MARNIVIAGIISGQRGGESSDPVGDRNISSVQPLPIVTVDFGTIEDSLPLPSVVIVTLEDNTLAELPIVDWTSLVYDGESSGDYTFTSEIGLVTGITNNANILAIITVRVRQDFEFDVYVDPVNGDDGNSGTSPDEPLETLLAAVTLAASLGGPRVISGTAGTYTLTSRLHIPENISIELAGVDEATIVGDVSLNSSHEISAFEWAQDEALLQMTSVSSTDGNQFLRGFTIDGESKSKHAGIHILNRNNVLLRDVVLRDFGMWGAWAINTDGLELLDVGFVDCADSATVASTGCLMLGSNTNTTINGLSVDESIGYGVKAFGPAPTKPVITNLLITNSNILVDPDSAYGDGSIPNITLELHDAYLINCEIQGSFFDNVVSLVTPTDQSSSYQGGATTVKFHNNTIDVNPTKGYPLECALHNVQIYNNYFKGGQNAAIANWNSGDYANGQLSSAKNNWLIYNNVFEAQESFFPVGIIKSRYTPLSNLQFYNNTIHITDGSGPHTVHIIQTENGMNNANWNIKNNVILDESTITAPPAQGGENTFIKLDGGGTIQNLSVTHNCIFGMPVGSIPNGVYSNNITVDPQLSKSGSKPSPYYRPLPSSPLIFAGTNVGLPFSGTAPTIGPFEALTVSTGIVQSVTNPNDIFIVSGKTLQDVNLPATVSVLLNNTATIPVAVTWDTTGYDPDVEDIYSFTGTLTMPTGITNPSSLTATIRVIVSQAIVVFTDSFDRMSIGSDYTVENVTPTLDGSNMQLTGSTGIFSRRVLRNTSLVDIPNLEVTAVIQVVQLTTSSYGVALGIQNIVNPDPNKGVFISFHMTTNSDAGTLTIWSGDSTTNNEGFTLRGTSTTQVPQVVGNAYELRLIRRVVGSDAIFTGTAKNLITGAITTVSYTEVGAGSLVYESTSKIAIYHFGNSAQQINNLTLQNSDVPSSFPNIVSVESVAPITVENGTLFGALGLPATLEVTLSDDTTDDYDINWEITGFSPTTPNTYTIVGTIELPVGITNSNNIIATAAVTVEAPTVSTTFTYYVDDAAGNDSNNGAIGTPFKTIQKAVDVATAGQSIAVRAGTYRETIILPRSGTSGSPITIAQYPGEVAVVSGLNELSAGGWTVHSGNIYKKTVTLPINGYDTSNALRLYHTGLFANQVFRNGEMMFEARWPKIDVFDDMFRRDKYRNLPYDDATGTAPAFQMTSLNDSSLAGVAAAPNLIGATLISNGWFMNECRTINGHSGNTISWSGNIWDNTTTGRWARQRYYLTGKLLFLTQANEWHYENGTLYLWQPGGGSPTGTYEYKARNVAFDGRGRSYITIAGLTFKGCDPFWGDSNSPNIIIDNTRATYNNHFVRSDRVEWQGVGMAKMFGTKLLGANSIFRNNEWHSFGAMGVWMGPNCIAENNYMHHIGYVGYWNHPLSLWGTDDGQKILRNTIHDVGRSCFDFGFNFGNAPGTSKHFNVEVAYNEFYRWGRISADVGATYSWGQCDLFGLKYHHNWIYETVVPGQSTGQGNGLGIGCAIYFDQATGPGEIYNNVTWNAGDTDVYHETVNNVRPTVGTWLHPDTLINFHHNTFATTTGSTIGGPVTAYRTYHSNPKDPQSNNIYMRQCVVNWPWLPGGGQLSHITNSVFKPGTTGGVALGTNSTATEPLFVGGNLAVDKGLYFRPASGSAAISRNAGAYQFGDSNPWVPGYVPVPYYVEDPVDPGSVDIDSIDTVVNDFDVAYNTAFGTNGAGIGLPQTIDVTYDDASTGTLDVTWTGTYTPTVPFFTDATYTLTGTPVLTGDITNTGSLTLSVDVTVKDAFFPLTAPIAAIYYTGGLVTNTTNDYGTVNSSNDITLLKSLAPGPTGRDMVPRGTAPKLSSGKAALIGTGAFQEQNTTTNFHFFHYNATPANLKWTYMTVMNQTDTNTTFGGVMGNNGHYGLNRGVGMNLYSSGTSAGIGILITNGSGVSTPALAWATGDVIPFAQDFLFTMQVDNAQAAGSGKVKAWVNNAVQNATSSGSGVFDNSVVPGKFEIGDYGTGGAYDTLGTFTMAIILSGVESDAVLAKLRSDVAAFTGITL